MSVPITQLDAVINNHTHWPVTSNKLCTILHRWEPKLGHSGLDPTNFSLVIRKKRISIERYKKVLFSISKFLKY